MKKTVLRKYAQLIAQTGVNVQPGQEVFIAADLDQPEFVKMLVEECYKRRAKKVVVDWSYQPAGSTMWTPSPAAFTCCRRTLTD